MKKQILISFLGLVLITSTIAYGNKVEIERLNPHLRQNIDDNLRSKVEVDNNANLNNQNSMLQDLFGKSNEATQFTNSMKNVDPDSFSNEGMKARDAEHNQVVKDILAHPNIEKLDEDDPVFAVFDEVVKDPTKFVSKECEQVLGETGGPSWKELKVRKKILNTEYEKNICEHLQNQYSCKETLYLTCKTPGTERIKVKSAGPEHIVHVNAEGLLAFHQHHDFSFRANVTFDLGELPEGAKLMLYGGMDHKRYKGKGEAHFILNNNCVFLPDGHVTGLDLTRFIKSGMNHIVLGFEGSMIGRFELSVPMCVDWLEHREETCSHIAVP